MTTLNPELTFRIEAHDGHFYQTAVRQKRGRISKRTEQFDLIIGSGTKGQTYLYWRQNALFELPVPYWTELNRWVNSPGYVDGSADFDRPVPPRCVDCHMPVQPSNLLVLDAGDSRLKANVRNHWIRVYQKTSLP